MSRPNGEASPRNMADRFRKPLALFLRFALLLPDPITHAILLT